MFSSYYLFGTESRLMSGRVPVSLFGSIVNQTSLTVTLNSSQHFTAVYTSIYYSSSWKTVNEYTALCIGLYKLGEVVGCFVHCDILIFKSCSKRKTGYAKPA